MVTLVPSVAAAGQAQAPASQSLAGVAADHAAKKQADRQAILNVLQREEVRKVAKDAGIPIDKATAAVAALDGKELAQAAQQAQQVNDALAGGQAITMSVWLIILVLLAVILLVLIA
ncbi:MAG: hypothetical protein M3R55_04635 [Acidobacteriota bacterium]|nr:hypothetical protein [Acidobacteriota bacterium]